MPIIMQQLKSPFIDRPRVISESLRSDHYSNYSLRNAFAFSRSFALLFSGSHRFSRGKECMQRKLLRLVITHKNRANAANTRAVGHTKRMPSLSRVHVSHTFRWAYKSDLMKIFCYSLWNSLEKLSLENTKPRSGISILTVNNQVNRDKKIRKYSLQQHRRNFSGLK